MSHPFYTKKRAFVRKLPMFIAVSFAIGIVVIFAAGCTHQGSTISDQDRLEIMLKSA